jgi:hypothetical protein
MGKGGGGGGQTTSTTNTSNIPEYARPYVETMLGATQRQLFTGKPQQETYTTGYDDQGNAITAQRDIPGTFDITGFKPYQAYGGTYDEEGNQLSYDPSKAIAGFSPNQQKYLEGTANLKLPGQFGQATDVTNAGIMGAMDTGLQGRGLQAMGMQAAQAGNQYAQQATNPYAMSAYMSPYMQNVVNTQQAEAQRASEIQAQQNNAQAVGAGAFGGSRQGLMEAERQRNLATQKGSIQAQGLQNAYQQAQQAQQYAANLGLQGQQAGAGMYGQGISAQQAGIGQALQGAGQLGSLGAQQLAAQQGILGAQAQAGATQQAREQQIINQSMTDYANAQQYPLMQLGTMSNMLRGLPMQAQTTNQYAAAPNAVTQGIGAAGALGSLMQANKAEGGVIKGYASGGITSYDVGGAVEADLEDMDIDGLKRQIKESSSPRVKQMAQRILAEKQIPVPRMAGGGIIAFAEGDQVEDKLDGIQLADAVQARDPNVMSDSDGIMMADARPRPAPAKPAPTPAPAPAVATPAEPAPAPMDAFATAQKDQAAQQAIASKSIEDIMAERQAIRERMGVGGNEPRDAYRAEQMAERANLKDEAERQRNLRLAEFFASWGSTPGSTLTAGMTALKKSIPGMVEDQKEAKKLKRESDKIIFDIDQATRLEKMGRIDEAAAIKEKAATHAQELNKILVTAQSQKYNADKQLEGTKITANRMAAAHESSANRADLRGQEAQRYNFQKNEQEARKAVANLEAQIAKEAKENTAYTTAKRIADSNVRGTDKTLKANAIKTVQEAEAGWKARREAANSDLDLARSQLNEINKNMGIGSKKGDNSGKDGAPPKRPPLDDPSLQRTP